MRFLRYHENKQRGSLDFPLDYHYIDGAHSRYEMPYHWHEEVEILHVLSGEFHISIDGDGYDLQPDDVVFLAPGQLHSGHPEDCVYECVVFDMRLLLKSNEHCRRYVNEILGSQLRVNTYFPQGSRVTRHTILPMFDALREQNEGSALITLGCLFQFVGEVYKFCAYERTPQLSANEAQKIVKLKKVFEIIENNVADPPSLEQLARSIGLSPRYFCRFFKEATHQTPMEYIGFYRIEQACYEMSATDKNVTEIAAELGFADVNYFIRCFKKYKGVTPKQYQLAIQGK